MNYLAHARHSLGRPWELAGTALPDWLRRLDRRLRIPRERAAAVQATAPDPRRVALAEGVLRNHDDDRRFHASPAFQETCAEVTAGLRAVAGGAPGFRASVVAHVLVEMLLDACLEETRPGTVDGYYADLGRVDPEDLEGALAPFLPHAPRPALAPLVTRFRASRFLARYARDADLADLLDAVLRRARLTPLPAAARARLPGFRSLVRGRTRDLLG